MVEGHKACNLCLHNYPLPPLDPDITLNSLSADTHSFSLNLRDPVLRPLQTADNIKNGG
jgi:hypothetical protein